MLRLLGCVAVLVVSASLSGQAPAGATGQCKDGTYTTAAKKTGACSRHQGIQTWFADSASAATSTPAAPAVPTQTAVTTKAAAQSTAPQAPPRSTVAATPSPAQKASPTSASAPAAGGGPGMVWVNSSTHVYHCPGSHFYGTTKNGKYLSESAAKGEGDRPDHGKACGL